MKMICGQFRQVVLFIEDLKANTAWLLVSNWCIKSIIKCELKTRIITNMRGNMRTCEPNSVIPIPQVSLLSSTKSIAIFIAAYSDCDSN